MHRTGFLLLLILALLSGFVARGMTSHSSIGIQAPHTAANGELADIFYSALNDALAGNEPAPVAALLSPLFQDHNAESGAARPAEAFLAEIQAIGASSARVRFDVRSVDAAGSTLVALVQQRAAGPLKLAGLTVEQAEPQPHVELLRVERGKVVDRWAPAIEWLNASTFDQDAPVISNSVGVSTSLTRIVMDGSHEQSWRTVGVGIVMVERGSVSMQLSGGPTEVAPIVLVDGDVRSIPSGMQARVRSANGAPVSLLRYTVTRMGASDATRVTSTSAEAPQGGTRTDLWSGVRNWSGPNLTNAPARVVLPPRGELRLALPENVELLAAASAEGIEITSPGTLMSMRGEQGWPVNLEGFVALDETCAAWIEGGQDVTLRNVSGDPVTLLLISVAVVPDVG